MSEINWDDNATKAVGLFYDFIDEQGAIYASPDKMQKDFFEWLGLSQQKTVADEPHFKATRENLEKIAKDAQEEKWTHVTSIGKCRVLIDTPDEHGYVVIEMENDGYSLIPSQSLKPIKPRITKAQAWDKYATEGLDPDWICGKYDIT